MTDPMELDLKGLAKRIDDCFSPALDAATSAAEVTRLLRTLASAQATIAAWNRRTSEAAEPVDEWLPVDDHARSGVEILAWVDDEGGGHNEVVRYDFAAEFAAERLTSGPYGPFVWANDSGRIGRDCVLRYRPLPAAPRLNAGEEGK